MSATTTPRLTEHELAAWRGMLQVHAGVTQQLDAQMHAEHGLSVSAYEVLMFLADAPALTLFREEFEAKIKPRVRIPVVAAGGGA